MVAPTSEENGSPGLADRVERALEALWRGDSADFERLLETGAGPSPRVGALLDDVVGACTVAVMGLRGLSEVRGYRILREIGRGGMGVVYEAEQQDPRRRVALKVLYGLHGDDFHVKLFRREIRVLARLQHAGIATFYEAGQTDEGHHFFTMELVEKGTPLNMYVRDSKASLRQRLELFLQIGDAVHYAHQRGVIHRDLKPSNIHVDGRGRPKVLDFGLARFTDSGITGAGTTLTEVGKVMGTLPYMSPEQVRGNTDEIDVRTDVYALGVLLYTLLTDQLPHDLGRVLPEGARRIICQEPPRKPRTLNPALPADLETITLKALAKESAQRYPSVLALAEDVQRYLTDQPVLARPPSVVYRLRKFARRNKTLATSAAVVVLALAMGFAGTAWQAVRATQQRDRAVFAEQLANQVIEYFRRMLSAVNPKQARVTEVNVTVRQMLEEASRRVVDEFQDQPQVRAALHETMGTTYHALRVYDRAEDHLRKALVIRREFRKEDPKALPAALRYLGVLLGDKPKPQYEEALGLLQESLALARNLWGEQDPEMAHALTGVGELYLGVPDYATAVRYYQQALDLWRALPGDHHREIARGLQNLADLHHERGLGEGMPEEYLLAQPLYEQAVAGFREGGDDPVGEAQTMSSLGNLLRTKGDLEAAEQMQRQVIDMRRQYLGDTHLYVGTSCMDLASLLREEGKYAESIPYAQEALDIYQKWLGEEHADAAGPRVGLAWALVRTERVQEGEEQIRKVLEVWQKTPPKDEWLVPEAESILGECLTARGDHFEQAEPLVLRGYQALQKARPGHYRARQALWRVCHLYEAWGKPEQALEFAPECRALLSAEEAPLPAAP